MNERRPFKIFSPAEDEVWQLLWAKQLPRVQQQASRLWLEGLELLGLNGNRVPNFTELNQRLMDLVGWELVSTDVVFSSGQDWFEHLAQREFLITEYIREKDVLDYTPLPDIWHDTFGHLPLMAHPCYADYIEKFGKYAIQFTADERKSLGSMWWYTIEFGFMMENGVMKAFGAGLMSSPGELDHALSNEVEKVPYSLEAFENIRPSPHEMHSTLFILDSMDQLEHSVEEWVAKYQREHAF